MIIIIVIISSRSYNKSYMMMIIIIIIISNNNYYYYNVFLDSQQPSYPAQKQRHYDTDEVKVRIRNLFWRKRNIFFGMAYLLSISFSFLLGIEGFISNLQFAPLVNHALNIKFWFDYSHEFLEDILILWIILYWIPKLIVHMTME